MEDRDIENLICLIEETSKHLNNAEIRVEGLSEEMQPLEEVICHCLRDVQEVYVFLGNMADGNLDVTVPGRHNFFAGPAKDLYYKFEHLTWQAKQVAKGDYSQRVDFMGSFSESFNFMVNQLKEREEKIKEHAEEKIKNMEKQNAMLRNQMLRQTAHYKSYRNFTGSYQNFRNKYKRTMGEIYSLFNNEEYEKGRLLVAELNDMMGRDIKVHKDYSNNDIINSALMEIANLCQISNIEFNGRVYVPDDYIAENSHCYALVMGLSTILFFLIENCGDKTQSLKITSSVKNQWVTILFSYSIDGSFDEMYSNTEFYNSLQRLFEEFRITSQEFGGVFRNLMEEEPSVLKFVLHICKSNKGTI